jgi:hypothetical protein
MCSVAERQSVGSVSLERTENRDVTDLKEKESLGLSGMGYSGQLDGSGGCKVIWVVVQAGKCREYSRPERAGVRESGLQVRFGG